MQKILFLFVHIRDEKGLCLFSRISPRPRAEALVEEKKDLGAVKENPVI